MKFRCPPQCSPTKSRHHQCNQAPNFLPFLHFCSLLNVKLIIKKERKLIFFFHSEDSSNSLWILRWCVHEEPSITFGVAIVELALLVVTTTWSPTSVTLLAGPFLLASKPCETSLLQDELSLTSLPPVVLQLLLLMGVGIWLEREGGRGCKDCSLLVEFRRAARGEAGGRGWRRTTETTLCVCSHILLNRRRLPGRNYCSSIIVTIS